MGGGCQEIPLPSKCSSFSVSVQLIMTLPFNYFNGFIFQSCAPGWRRESNQLYAGVCQRCQCYNHAAECDSFTGACQVGLSYCCRSIACGGRRDEKRPKSKDKNTKRINNDIEVVCIQVNMPQSETRAPCQTTEKRPQTRDENMKRTHKNSGSRVCQG